MACENCQITARLDRKEAGQARIEELLKRLAPQAESPVSEDDQRLAALLRRTTKGDWFTTGAVIRAVEALAQANDAEGQPEPRLAEALRDAGIQSPRALSNWLSGHDGGVAERGEAERAGIQWKIRG